LRKNGTPVRKIPPEIEATLFLFHFFNERLLPPVKRKAFEEIKKAYVLLVIGSLAEVFPTNVLPQLTKEQGAIIVGSNPHPSPFTERFTDIFL
jgi:NAD-dependent SIR2 family protein deacetylase